MINLKNIYKFIDGAFNFISCDNTEIDIDSLVRLIFVPEDCNEHGKEFFKKVILKAKSDIKIDLEFFMQSDPAANTYEEIIVAYPGYLAIAYYRIANILYTMGYAVQSRIIMESCHKKTGIDIHPGAKIGCPFFIDHGTGIVIGETAIVGHHVKIYQGVTLGALSLSEGHKMKGTKRHPTIGNYVTIYAGASILGDIKVGNNVTIGGNTFIMDNIQDNVKVTIAKPELVIKEKHEIMK